MVTVPNVFRITIKTRSFAEALVIGDSIDGANEEGEISFFYDYYIKERDVVFAVKTLANTTAIISRLEFLCEEGEIAFDYEYSIDPAPGQQEMKL